MANLVTEKAKISVALAGSSSPDRESALQSISQQWNLLPIEDVLLHNLLPPQKGEQIRIDAYTELLNLFRNEKIVPFDATFLSKDYFEPSVVQDQVFMERLLRTLYLIIKNEDADGAIMLRTALEVDIRDQLGFWKNIIDETSILLMERARIIITVYFFHLAPLSSHLAFFGSNDILEAITMGFNVEEVVRRYVDNFTVFENRQDSCITFAAALAANEAPLGRDVQSKSVPVKYWIDNFRIYSQNNFGGVDLVNFFQNKEYTTKCSVEEKELMRIILEFYTHLINGYLMTPNGDVEAVKKLAARLATVPNITAEEADRIVNLRYDWATLLSVPLNDTMRQLIADWLNQQNPLETVSILKEELKNLRWQEEPYLSNILYISDIFEKGIGVQFGPLVLFDEAVGTFVWNDGVLEEPAGADSAPTMTISPS